MEKTKLALLYSKSQSRLVCTALLLALKPLQYNKNLIMFHFSFFKQL